jgi:hypothetical protein
VRKSKEKGEYHWSSMYEYIKRSQSNPYKSV